MQMKMPVKIIQVLVDKLQHNHSVLRKVLEGLELEELYNKHHNNNQIYLVDHQLLEILFSNNQNLRNKNNLQQEELASLIL